MFYVINSFAKVFCKILLANKKHDKMSVAEISTTVKEMAGLARDKKLTPEMMQGSTFTISNLGMFGIESFTSIINPPNSCNNANSQK